MKTSCDQTAQQHHRAVETPKCSPATAAAVASGPGGETWGQVAWNAARSHKRLPATLHQYLATHPDRRVRRSWSERDDVPGDLAAALLKVEKDQETRHNLQSRTSRPDGRSVEWVLASEGRWSLVARAMNPHLSDEDAAAHLVAALPKVPTRTSRLAMGLASSSSERWNGRPETTKVLLQAAENPWELQRLAELCTTPELAEVLFRRVRELCEADAEVLHALRRSPLTETLQGLVAETYQESEDPEVQAYAKTLADPVRTAKTLNEELQGPSLSGDVLGALQDLLQRTDQGDLLEACTKAVRGQKEELHPSVCERIGRSVLFNQHTRAETAEDAATLLTEPSAVDLADPVWRLPRTSRKAVLDRVGTVPKPRGRTFPRPRPSRQLAHALAENPREGLYAAPAVTLLGHLEPWLGTPAEETLAALLSNWEGTLQELLGAVSVVDGTPALQGLPKPVRKRFEDEPPF